LCPNSLRRMWPIQLHFLFQMLLVIGSCFVLRKSSSFVVRSGHLMRRIRCRQVLVTVKTYRLLSRFLLCLQIGLQTEFVILELLK
jgi:hypothetical protein